MTSTERAAAVAPSPHIACAAAVRKLRNMRTAGLDGARAAAVRFLLRPEYTESWGWRLIHKTARYEADRSSAHERIDFAIRSGPAFEAMTEALEHIIPAAVAARVGLRLLLPVGGKQRMIVTGICRSSAKPGDLAMTPTQRIDVCLERDIVPLLSCLGEILAPLAMTGTGNQVKDWGLVKPTRWFATLKGNSYGGGGDTKAIVCADDLHGAIDAAALRAHAIRAGDALVCLRTPTDRWRGRSLLRAIEALPHEIYLTIGQDGAVGHRVDSTWSFERAGEEAARIRDIVRRHTGSDVGEL